MPTIKFTANLKRFYPELTEIEMDSLDLNEILDALESKFKGLKDYVVDEQGQLRKHVNIFIGDELIRDRIALSDAVKPTDEIYIMQALSGG
ncbi:molybdopterin synthase subunit MoaD [Reichenbachiella faecimaris]|uniref:Molybdopterin synthase subunit MoaD n=1 Tax=Reichenbachiella faecimaris TaxID=692418 RepID=A0A1W2G7Q6_REIFA|nr:MoaD/ThiS family protein [Reichenbachiella faecimaris]SMD32719.1 molybdopterin synthase subunit MoaD [Reichenbachiella faecimaris]